MANSPFQTKFFDLASAPDHLSIDELKVPVTLSWLNLYEATKLSTLTKDSPEWKEQIEFFADFQQWIPKMELLRQFKERKSDKSKQLITLMIPNTLQEIRSAFYTARELSHLGFHIQVSVFDSENYSIQRYSFNDDSAPYNSLIKDMKKEAKDLQAFFFAQEQLLVRAGKLRELSEVYSIIAQGAAVKNSCKIFGSRGGFAFEELFLTEFSK